MRFGTALAVMPGMLLGCAIRPGENYVVVAGHRSHGLVADTLPPGWQLIADEWFIGHAEPTFEGGKGLPVLSHIEQSEAAGGRRYRFSLVATGAAATTALGSSSRPSENGGASDRVAEDDWIEGTVELSRMPDWDSAFSPGEIAPTWVNADWSMGLQLELFGPGVLPLPQSFLVGSREKELFVAPVMASDLQGTGAATRGRVGTSAAIASFRWGRTHDDGEFKREQFLASGAAAILLARQEGVGGSIRTLAEWGAVRRVLDQKAMLERRYEESRRRKGPSDPDTRRARDELVEFCRIGADRMELGSLRTTLEDLEQGRR